MAKDLSHGALNRPHGLDHEFRLGHLERLRSEELFLALPLFPVRGRILEIGAGMGWQAQVLAERGFSVTAIDVAGTITPNQRVYTVIEYDGFNIPFPNNHFDIVFSSNVLEHVHHLDEFQSEIKRVLSPGGKAIHILPSGCWRFWTTLGYYPYVIKRIWNDTFSAKISAVKEERSDSRPRPRVSLQKLFPSRHGERGNFLTEVYFFNRWYWRQHFHRTGWKIEAYYPNQLFYTGYEILNLGISLPTRRKLSHFLGSASHVFCLQKVTDESE